MSLGNVTHQKPETSGPANKHRGETAGLGVGDEAGLGRHEPRDLGTALLDRALCRENMVAAWKRVKANRGSAGADGLSIADTVDHLKAHWPSLRDALLNGTYRPTPVRRVLIPKADGTQRELGIPTVTDRLIQQALLQVLQPLIDPTFSDHSYGLTSFAVEKRLGRDAERTTRYCGRKGTCRRDAASWWMWTWRSSLTASITMY